jgi:phage-related minor tail protein
LFNANGNAFDGGVQAFATGGAFTNSIVDSPTAFKFASGAGFNLGVMGEAGPEAVMPLRRDASGRLGVAGGGSQVNVSTTFAPVIQAAPGTDINGILSAVRQLMPAFIAENKTTVVGAVNQALASRGQALIRV